MGSPGLGRISSQSKGWPLLTQPPRSRLGTRSHTSGRSRPSPSRLVGALKPKGRSRAEAAWEARWAQVGARGFAPNPRGRRCGGTRTPRPLFTMFTSAGKGEGRRGKEGEGEGIRVEGRRGWGNTNPGTLPSTKLREEDKVQNCEEPGKSGVAPSTQ